MVFLLWPFPIVNVMLSDDEEYIWITKLTLLVGNTKKLYYAKTTLRHHTLQTILCYKMQNNNQQKLVLCHGLCPKWGKNGPTVQSSSCIYGWRGLGLRFEISVQAGTEFAFFPSRGMRNVPSSPHPGLRIHAACKYPKSYICLAGVCISANISFKQLQENKKFKRKKQ